MAELPIRCSSCQADYVLPDAYRQHLEGRAVFCVDCQRWWVAIPATSGPPVRLVKGRPERAPVDLRPFRRGPQGPGASTVPASSPPLTAAPPATAAAPAPPPPMPMANQTGTAGLDSTARVPVTQPTSPSLRVVVTAAGKDAKAVFDLGSKTFLIGQQRCHLNLKQAAIPEVAVRVRAQGQGFHFEGVDGFEIPIGSISIGSGHIEPGGSVRFQLNPYEIQLEISATPGRPIADLEPATGAAPPAATPAHPPVSSAPPPGTATPQSPAPYPPPTQGIPPSPGIPQNPAPAAPQPPPAASWPATTPTAAQPPAAVQSPGLQSPGAPVIDLRSQVQELAIEVRPDQQTFEEAPGSMQQALDVDATITDLGAVGFQASRFGNPLAGLDLSLVRLEGPLNGQAFKITKSPVVVGRKEGDMIVHDGRVSSKHAQLDIAGARLYTVKDLASTNGTTVNDRPISVGPLQDGDVISFGGVKFEFRAKQA